MTDMTEQIITDLSYDFKDFQKEYRQDQKQLQMCLTNMKVKDAKQEGELSAIKTELVTHKKDKNVHYNAAIADESLSHRLKRKSPEIAAGGGVATFGMYLLIKIIEVVEAKGGI